MPPTRASPCFGSSSPKTAITDMLSPSNVTEIRGDKRALNIAAGLLTVLLAAAGILVAHQFPRHTPFAEVHALALLGALVVVLPVHELLHALGMVWFGKVSWSNIKFGVFWRALIPYCHCRVPVSLRVYRRMALLPLWGTGAATIIPLILFPADWLGVLAGITMAACAGDLWVVWKLRSFTDESMLVQDSPTDIGCDVYSGPPVAAS